MSVSCCSLAGTAACQHCRNNPLATDVWSNLMRTRDEIRGRIEAWPFGNGVDVCPVCGKPSTIGKPQTNADRIRSMTDEELANLLAHKVDACHNCSTDSVDTCVDCWLEWLKKEDER